MKKQLRSIFGMALGMALATGASAQERFLEEVFNDGDIVVTKDVVYGANIDYLRNTDLLDPAFVQANAAAISVEKDSLLSYLASQNVAALAPFYDPTDTTTILKITGGTADPTANPSKTLTMDVYQPSPAVDTMAQRPVIVYIHTGNFLPPIINGGVGGSKEDSVAVEFCTQWAKRGYVAIAPNYRHGWNPVASGPTGPVVRRATLLNAVYRALHDVKRAVRVTRAQAATFGVDPMKIAVFGQGSGGYVALAYNTLDQQSETATAKFINPATGQSYIDPNAVGDIEGAGGLLNLYGDLIAAGVPSAIQAQANIGGALGDISWMNGATPSPMISIHCIRDPFAPFDTGQVIVPTTGEDVVPVPGPATFMPVANDLGVNDSFKDKNDFNDPYTFRARQLYGRTFDHFANNVTIEANSEGLFALELPLQSNQFQNQGSPWEWWAESDVVALAAAVNASTGGSYDGAQIHSDALISNPDMSKSKALTYIDSIQGYLHPRLMLSMNIGNVDAVGTEELYGVSGVTMFPNPASAFVEFAAVGEEVIESIEVFDLTGKVAIAPMNVRGNYFNVDISRLNSGIYLVKINTSKGVSTERLVVE